ncbi:YeeE/YedE family protein [Halomonas sp. NCCP-2165]|nr:YeeE/YedE family protein [Halomonas sp. NCCP-2165]GKW49806.1 membrane protein [Halomonas sp. NCCP-2165]
MDWSASLHGLAGGVLIGLSATWLMGSLGRIAGISGILSSLVFERPRGDSAWRLTFLLGLISGPLLVMASGGGLGNVAGQGAGAVIGAPAGGVGLMVVAGLLVGLGTGIGSGCTSGHGVCGLSRLSPRSLAATLTFLSMAMVTVYVVRHLLGGGA